MSAPRAVVPPEVFVLAPGAFRSDNHEYWYNGKGPVPSVTTVLGIIDKPAVVTWKAKETARAIIRRGTPIGALMQEDELIRWALKESDKARDTAAELGSSVHLLADMVGNAPQGQGSDSNGFPISDREFPYVEAFRDFLERYKRSNIVSSEKMVWSENGYGGTYDLMMLIDVYGKGPEFWLIDIKTSKGIYPEFGLQLAGYRWADSIILAGNPTSYPMPSVHRTGVLHLRPDAYPDTGWRLIEYPTTYEKDYIAFLAALELYTWRKEGRFRKSQLSIAKAQTPQETNTSASELQTEGS